MAFFSSSLQAQPTNTPPQPNNKMFPAEPAAANSIGWQGSYFIVGGKPTILWSGSMHYARIPRELWRERLVEAKRAGINTIQTYVFWNAHEPKSGVFDFSDNLDLDAWSQTLEEVGLYATVRMGPYITARCGCRDVPLLRDRANSHLQPFAR